MLFCVTFQDNQGKEHLRQKHMADHLTFLETVGARMLGAGPLFDGSEGHGGMWLLEAESAEAVQTLVEQDPFWPTGLRKSVAILEWRPVFREGRRV